MFSSYRAEDVTILLKDITGLVPPMATAERERLEKELIDTTAQLARLEKLLNSPFAERAT